MPHDLKALALAAMEATAKADYFRQERVFNDDRAYWFMIEHDAWEAYRKAATPERILQFRNEVLEGAAQHCEKLANEFERAGNYDQAFAYDECADTLRALKTGVPEAESQPCHSAKDGECQWVLCPQLRDGEPEKSGRNCPLTWPAR